MPNAKLSRRTFAAALLAAPACNAAEPRITDLTAEGAVNNPYGLRTGPDGALYICEIGNHRISRLDLKSGKLTTVLAGQNEPYDLRFDKDGTLYFVDMPAHQVRSLDLKSGKVTVVAGTGTPGYAGDGGSAPDAQLRQPHSLAFDSQGRLLICDIGNHRIRMVENGRITTFAGTGAAAATPEGAPRADTPINGPRAIDFDSTGALCLVLREGNCVLRLDPKSNRFHLLAGTGAKGYSGDGGDARQAKLSGPKAICCFSDGSVYLADTESHTIRRVSPDGTITTVVGDGTRGDGPPGHPLTCRLARPHGAFIDASGSLYIGDSENHRVRKVV